MKKINKQSLLITGVTLSLLLSIALTIIVTINHAHYQDFVKDTYINNTQSVYFSQKLEFCINNSIMPCNDQSLTNWNNSHPEKTFDVKTFKDLVEEGIDQYEAL